MNTSFTNRVYEIVVRIPRGKVATYGRVAALAGSPGAARAVGMVIGSNPDPQTIPCHRVVGADGSLRGYAFGNGVTTKRELLISEGVVMAGSRVNLAVSRWNG